MAPAANSAGLGIRERTRASAAPPVRRRATAPERAARRRAVARETAARSGSGTFTAASLAEPARC